MPVAVEAAGAFALLLELVQPEVAEKITSLVAIPTIGIGAGPQCDGQVLVTHDFIGLFPWFTPKFVTREAEVASEISRAVSTFVRQTKSRQRVAAIDEKPGRKIRVCYAPLLPISSANSPIWRNFA